MQQKKSNYDDSYIPSREGEKILGVKRNLFFHYVTSGQIKRQERAGEPDVYSHADILKVKEKRDKKKKKLYTEVDWMKPSDLSAILKLDFEVYKEDMVGDIGLYISWYRKNPKITLLSFDASDREKILAYISLVPMKEQTILSILKNDRKELSIEPEDIETYERSGGYTLLAESVVIHPEHPEQLSNIFKRVLDFWYDQYPDRYIEKIYAQAVSEDGDVLVRKLFFSPLYDLAEDAYVLDVKRKGVSIIVRKFQESLKDKESKHL